MILYRICKDYLSQTFSLYLIRFKFSKFVGMKPGIKSRLHSSLEICFTVWKVSTINKVVLQVTWSLTQIAYTYSGPSQTFLI